MRARPSVPTCSRRAASPPPAPSVTRGTAPPPATTHSQSASARYGHLRARQSADRRRNLGCDRKANSADREGADCGAAGRRGAADSLGPDRVPAGARAGPDIPGAGLPYRRRRCWPGSRRTRPRSARRAGALESLKGWAPRPRRSYGRRCAGEVPRYLAKLEAGVGGRGGPVPEEAGSCGRRCAATAICTRTGPTAAAPSRTMARTARRSGTSGRCSPTTRRG